MSYFITEQKLKLNLPATLTDSDVAHILFSRRTKIGDTIAMQDASQTRFECEIISATKNSITITPQQILETPEEPKLKIHIFQALVNEAALDIILQKSTELGASSILIFNAARSPIKFDATAFAKKQNRWQKIALEAAKQSDRLLAPEIKFATDLSSALNELNFPLFVLDPKASKSIIDQSFDSTEMGLLIGPEGGLEETELKLLSDHKGILPVRLGPRILRAETACLAGVTLLQAKFGDLA